MIILRDDIKRSTALASVCRGNKWAKILLIALLAVILVSGFFIVTHAQHDCVGPGCHTCEEISVCRLIVDGIAVAALLIFALGLARGRLSAARADLTSGFGPVSKTRFLSGHVRLNC